MPSPPKLRSLEFLLGVIFDARRAVFFERERLLAVADLHLGYAWANRAQGQLLPLGAREEALARLRNLVEDYAPRRLLLLGDIVHRALPLAELKKELDGLLSLAEAGLEIILVAGNHDRQLQRLLKEMGRKQLLQTQYAAGENIFLHGDRPATLAAKRYVIGHEHPAICLGDGVATSRKFPCFLVAENLLTLPSFSNWSAHTPIHSYEFMSPLARSAKFQTALAILGERLLPVPIRK